MGKYMKQALGIAKDIAVGYVTGKHKGTEPKDENEYRTDSGEGPGPEPTTDVPKGGTTEVTSPSRTINYAWSYGTDSPNKYTMSGMSWKTDQSPMKSLNGVSSSPLKEPVTLAAIAAGSMIVGGVMDYFSEKSRRKHEAKMGNVQLRNEAKLIEREEMHRGQDKMATIMGAKAQTGMDMYKSGMQAFSSKKFS